MEGLRQAGRGQNAGGLQLGVLEQAHLAGLDVGRGDQQARRIRRAQAIEVDQAAQEVLERVQPERIELVGREHMRREVEREARERAATGGCPAAQLGDAAPECIEAGAGRFGATLQPASREDHGIHRPGRSAADRPGTKARIFEQAVEHAPGERSVRAAALERKRERPAGRRAVQPGCQGTPLPLAEPHQGSSLLAEEGRPGLARPRLKGQWSRHGPTP